MITRLEATRYRCFERLDIDLGEYQLLVGPNGSGKTTLLDIPGLFGDLLRSHSIGSAFVESANGRSPRSKTFSELVFAERGSDFTLTLEAKLPPHVTRQLEANYSSTTRGGASKHGTTPKGLPTHLRYELRLEHFEARGLEVKNEYLILFPDTQRPDRNGPRVFGERSDNPKSWRLVVAREAGQPVLYRREAKAQGRAQEAHVDPSQLGLSRVQFESKEQYPAARWLFEFLTRSTVFFEPDWTTLQVGSPPGLPKTVVASGKNLPWLALTLKRQNLSRYKSWVAHVREALRNVVDIDVREREDDHHAYFIVKYSGNFTVMSSGLSDGTLRVLALTLLAYLEQHPASLVTEEPENGIHPRAVEAVLQSLSSLYGSQVWVSSHSPVVLAHSKIEHMLCTQLGTDGAVTVVRGPDHPRLKEWKGAIDLGSLFAAGVLG